MRYCSFYGRSVQKRYTKSTNVISMMNIRSRKQKDSLALWKSGRLFANERVKENREKTETNKKVVMNAVNSVKHDGSSYRPSNCILETNSDGITTLWVYKSKKILSEHERLPKKLWFSHAITGDLSVLVENTYTLFLFHIHEKHASSTFSFHSSYNRDSWVSTINRCRPNSSSKSSLNNASDHIFDHTGKSPKSMSKRFASTNSEFSPQHTVACSNLSSVKCDNFTSPTSGKVDSKPQLSHSKVSTMFETPRNKSSVSASRKEFLDSILAERRGKTISPCAPHEVSDDEYATRDSWMSSIYSTTTFSSPRTQVSISMDSRERANLSGLANISQSPSSVSNTYSSNRKSNSRREFLSHILQEKNHIDDTPDDEDDDLDFVPKSH